MYNEIKILETFKSLKPWIGNYEIKNSKFNYFLIDLCELYDLKNVPKLLILKNNKEIKWSKKYLGDYSRNKNKIRLKNFSIITLLHEFKHYIDINIFNVNDELKLEFDAIYYSIYLFYSVWPERLKLLQALKDINYKNKLSIIKKVFDLNDPYQKATYDVYKNIK